MRGDLPELTIGDGPTPFTVSRVFRLTGAHGAASSGLEKRALSAASLRAIDQSIALDADIPWRCTIALLIAVGMRETDGGAGEYPSALAYGVGLVLSRKQPDVRWLGCGPPPASGCPSDLILCTPLHQARDIELESNLVWLDVNNQPVHAVQLDDAVPDLSEVIASIADDFDLVPGDLLLAGPNAPPIALKPRDIVRAGIEGLISFRLKISCRPTP